MSYFTTARAAFFFSLTALIFVAGCATSLPPSLGLSSEEPMIPGAVLALAGSGDRIVLANARGVFLKTGEGEWEALEVPGLSDHAGVTTIALDADEIAIGTREEGLFLFSEDAWETRSSKYGGLPDDTIQTIAFEGVEEGLPGNALWVATQTGLSVRRNGEWTDFLPDRQWLTAIASSSDDSPGGSDDDSDSGNIYVGAGFQVGKRGGDSDLFRPPVTTIAIADGLVLFGNRLNRLAMVNEKSAAIFHFTDGFNVTDVLTGGKTLWTGTNGGLLWGKHLDSMTGRPWPTNHAQINWRGTLFGKRDSRPFGFKWYRIGYNLTHVVGLAGNSADLWTAFGDGKKLGVQPPP